MPTHLARAASGHFFTYADVNEQPVRFIVDTGADIVALTPADARAAVVKFDPAAFTVIGRGAGGDVRGEAVRIDNLVLDGKRATDLRAVVIENADVSLLGQTYLRQIRSVRITGDEMVLE